jgi:hypothetical protein
MHGFVLALRAGVPAVALDPIAGGAKVAAQAAALDWPAACTVDEASVPALAELLDWCLTDEARAGAAACSQSGRRSLEQTHMQLLELLTGDGGGARAPACPTSV